MNNTSLLLFTLSTTLFTACIDEGIEGDPIDGAFLSENGKSDAFGIEEGSPDARGVLEVANTLVKHELVDEVGLVTRAANKIIAHRAGADGVLDTEDDDRFDDLEELDAVPWIGEISFEHLLEFARAHGYVAVDLFSADSCTGPAITLAELQTHTANGTRPLPGGQQTWIRSRTCSGALGCGDWGAPRELADPGVSSLSYTTSAGLRFRAAYDRSEIVSLPQGPLERRSSYEWNFALTTATTPEIIPGIAVYDHWFGDNVSGRVAIEDVALTFTRDCMRAYGRLPASGETSTSSEHELVFLATF